MSTQRYLCLGSALLLATVLLGCQSKVPTKGAEDVNLPPTEVNTPQQQISSSPASETTQSMRVFAREANGKMEAVLSDGNGEHVLLSRELLPADMGGPIFNGFLFSPSERYLRFTIYNWEDSDLLFFDTGTRQKILELDDAHTFGWSLDENYAFACSNDHIAGENYGRVFELPSGSPVFDLSEYIENINMYMTILCTYNEDNGDVIFEGRGMFTADGSDETVHKIFVYNLRTGNVQELSESDWRPDPSRFIPQGNGLYLQDRLGVLFRVPPSVEVNVQDRHTETGFVLSARETFIEELDEPLGYGKENALQSKRALEMGVFGPDMDFLLPDSREVIRINNEETNGKTFMVLQRFEVCDITFDRTLVFYHNDHQIVLALSAPSDILMREMSEYFTTDPANCRMADTGENLPVWKEDGPEGFYAAVSSGQASPLAEQWFRTFDDIVESIELF